MHDQQLSDQSERSGSPAKVTVIITTYNHERFIRQSIDSVLEQETDFAFDVVIIEDCSTDRTREIVTEYQQSHPRKIRLVLPESNRNDNWEFMRAVESCTSPYIALPDGDDYWTCRHKLQKQVDYLDRHPECTICFHNVSVVHDDGSQPPQNANPPDQKEVTSLDDLLDGCFIETCSTVLRRSAVGSFPDWYIKDTSPDWSLFAFAAQHGYIGYINEVMGVYRLHAGGYWTGQGNVEQRRRVIQFYENVRGYLPPQYTERIAALLACHCYDLAIEHDRNGTFSAAQQSFSKALGFEPDIRNIKWTLRVAEGSAARLELPPGNPDAMRISIQKAGTERSFDIQLNERLVSVTNGHRYVVRFLARADQPRHLFIGFSQAHDPWQDLGLYKRIEAGSEWQCFQEEFVATSDESNGRVHFDVGGSDIPVELSSVSICSLTEGRSAEPDRGLRMYP